jgi:hypothetical protein
VTNQQAQAKSARVVLRIVMNDLCPTEVGSRDFECSSTAQGQHKRWPQLPNLRRRSCRARSKDHNPKRKYRISVGSTVSIVKTWAKFDTQISNTNVSKSGKKTKAEKGREALHAAALIKAQHRWTRLNRETAIKLR